MAFKRKDSEFYWISGHEELTAYDPVRTAAVGTHECERRAEVGRSAALKGQGIWRTSFADHGTLGVRQDVPVKETRGAADSAHHLRLRLWRDERGRSEVVPAHGVRALGYLRDVLTLLPSWQAKRRPRGRSQALERNSLAAKDSGAPRVPACSVGKTRRRPQKLPRRREPRGYVVRRTWTATLRGRREHDRVLGDEYSSRS